MNASRPLLIFDGECGFCRYWVRYWQRLTGDAVSYRPYQEVGERFPEISEEAFQGSIQLIDADGQRFDGAEAAFRVLAVDPSRRGWLWLYRHVPGVAALSEGLYRRVATHRPVFHRVCRWLWGSEVHPVRFDRITWLFLRAMGLIYLSAFTSFWVQAHGLIGSDGILPLNDLVAGADALAPLERFTRAPTLFWFGGGDGAIHLICALGVLSSVGIIVDRLLRFSLVLAWIGYLSIFHGGQVFTTYQWDLLLLEVGFLAIFLPGHRQLVAWLYRLLLFRFMWFSGYVKLASGDSTWRDLSALSYHFETQPLPTPLAWYAHQLPDAILRTMTLGVFLVELVLPFLYFLPRWPRWWAAWGTIVLELIILATGNYNFFNLLTLALCLFLFADYDLSGRIPAARQRSGKTPARLAALLVVLLSLSISYIQLTRTLPPQPLLWLVEKTAGWQLVNGYGLFAVMTTRRPEIIVEGSADGEDWRAYDFKFKPDEPGEAPGFIIPHQPRLDWQLWFAALQDYRRNPWFTRFLERLGEGSPAVLALVGDNPFPDEPPRFLRARLFDYRFAAPVDRKRGLWWERELVGLYHPVVRIDRHQ